MLLLRFISVRTHNQTETDGGRVVVGTSMLWQCAAALHSACLTPFNRQLLSVADHVLSVAVIDATVP